MKSDELFDKLADRMEEVAKAIKAEGTGEYVIPSIEDIQALYDEINTKLQDLEKLDDSVFVIKTSNEFYFIGMYLKAAKMQGISRRDSVLAGLTQSDAIGSDISFVRKEMKELKKRLTA